MKASRPLAAECGNSARSALGGLTRFPGPGLGLGTGMETGMGSGPGVGMEPGVRDPGGDGAGDRGWSRRWGQADPLPGAGYGDADGAADGVELEPVPGWDDPLPGAGPGRSSSLRPTALSPSSGYLGY